MALVILIYVALDQLSRKAREDFYWALKRKIMDVSRLGNGIAGSWFDDLSLRRKWWHKATDKTCPM